MLIEMMRNLNYLNWMLTAKTYLKPEEWIDLFKIAGYTGFYYWTILEISNEKLNFIDLYFEQIKSAISNIKINSLKLAISILSIIKKKKGNYLFWVLVEVPVCKSCGE